MHLLSCLICMQYTLEFDHLWGLRANLTLIRMNTTSQEDQGSYRFSQQSSATCEIIFEVYCSDAPDLHQTPWHKLVLIQVLSLLCCIVHAADGIPTYRYDHFCIYVFSLMPANLWIYTRLSEHCMPSRKGRHATRSICVQWSQLLYKTPHSAQFLHNRRWKWGRDLCTCLNACHWQYAHLPKYSWEACAWQMMHEVYMSSCRFRTR